MPEESEVWLYHLIFLFLLFLDHSEEVTIDTNDILDLLAYFLTDDVVFKYTWAQLFKVSLA